MKPATGFKQNQIFHLMSHHGPTLLKCSLEHTIYKTKHSIDGTEKDPQTVLSGLHEDFL